MKKLVTSEALIIIVTIALVLPLAFSSHSTSVTKYHQAINQNNASRAITLDLKKGQIVTGSLDFTGDTNGAWFQIYDPNVNPPKTGDITYEGHHVVFTFTADIDGQYHIRVGGLDFFTQYIDYSYSISPAPILSIDPTALIGVVITIGVLLAVTTAVLDLYLTRKRKNKVSN